MLEKLFQRKMKRIQKRGERQKAKYELESQYARYYPHKNGKRVSNIMLIIVVASIVIYTVASFWLAYTTGVSIDSTLTTCFYAFWTVEILSLAGIRISKTRKTADDEYACEDENACEDEEV